MFSFSGDQVPGVNLNANALNSAPRNRYVNFDFTGGLSFDQIVFGASFRTFEFDNVALAGAVPELSSWAMMLIGFGGLGLITYRRAKKLPGIDLIHSVFGGTFHEETVRCVCVYRVDGAPGVG